ncbi:alpha-(1,3)-fucosyltransferase C-like isoform X2 [Babylonia areolata]|uniref:alpha-(1,3)-fucosyltransferase C-like isoform X2 n=1 Tax=Babylonia areolata TaxID=304850 RepID=UPI003FD1AA36
MACRCRWWRHCRLQPPSKITSRNRNVLYVVLFLPLLLTFLLIPGGEIANFKYGGDTSKAPFITTFEHQGGRHGDAAGAREDGDDVVRETRAVEGNKVIVLWNGFFESRTWRVQGNAFQGCGEARCELSLDRGRVSGADAVLFDARGLYRSPRLPEEHPPWQVWILHNSEPPYNIYIDLRAYDNVFNWTSWYRTDADIFAPYGYCVDKEAGSGNDDGDDHEDVNGEDGDDNGVEGDDDGDDRPKDVYRLHDRVLYFAASNCRDRGRRYKKVGQLSKYLPIDLFGDCGTYQCPKGNANCDGIFGKYQFVLAFENGYCRDYVSEKLWTAYKRQQIPIVSGGADYTQFAIPGSYIDYDNFSSVEELAAFVHRVSTDPALYNSYFRWHQRYEAAIAPVTDWCAICEALHDKGRPPQVYKNLAGWVAQDSCPLYSKYQYFWTQIYLGVYKLFGV